jgi:hypothetical protein
LIEEGEQKTEPKKIKEKITELHKEKAKRQNARRQRKKMVVR